MIAPFHLLHRSKGRSGALLLRRTTGLPLLLVTAVTAVTAVAVTS
jgi:hypothetical protein